MKDFHAKERREGRSERLPQLGALRVFEAAARHESFVQASEELHVTQGAVSKQIKSLELDLGEALFERRNRAVVLTERGRWLATRLSDVFANLESVLSAFRRERQEEPLVVSCEPTLCLKVLIPGLSDLATATGLDVRVLAAGGRVDFRRDRVHLAVRRNDFSIDAALATYPLAPEAMGLVCAPRLAESARARSAAPLLLSKSRPSAWAAWARSGVQKIRCTGEIVYEHFYMAIEAATAGQGIALVSRHMVDADLRAGRLAALTDFVADGTNYLALVEREADASGREALFIDWLGQRMRRHLTDGESQASTRRASTPAADFGP